MDEPLCVLCREVAHHHLPAPRTGVLAEQLDDRVLRECRTGEVEHRVRGDGRLCERCDNVARDILARGPVRERVAVCDNGHVVDVSVLIPGAPERLRRLRDGGTQYRLNIEDAARPNLIPDVTRTNKGVRDLPSENVGVQLEV